jgi:hypothetical protein
MIELLQFLVERCGFLWRDGRYRIIASSARGDDAVIVVTSEIVRLRFVCTRSAITIEAEAAQSTMSPGRYELPALVRILGLGSDLAKPDAGRLLEVALDEIERFFGDTLSPVAG